VKDLEEWVAKLESCIKFEESQKGKPVLSTPISLLNA
jgi:hypothetical protein